VCVDVCTDTHIDVLMIMRINVYADVLMIIRIDVYTDAHTDVLMLNILIYILIY
jgi:hypothetical protein